jgi:hypothetical protein
MRRAGSVRLIGPTRLARAFPGWFIVTGFAKSLRPVARVAAGATAAG